MLHSTSDLYGASRIFLQTAEIFKEQGAMVEVFLSEPGPLSEALSTKSINVHFLRLGILRRKYLHPVGILNRIYFLVRAVLILKKFILDEQMDLVYNNTAGVVSGLFAANLTGRPHLWHIHEIIVQPRSFARLTANWMKTRSDLNVFVSDATMDHWTTLDPQIVHLNKGIRIYNGILPAAENEPIKAKQAALDHFKLKFTDDISIIGMIGRINPWKGQTYFVEIARALTGKTKSVHFVMAGDPFPGYEYIREEIGKKIKSYGLQTFFTDLGYQANNEQFFNLIDLLIVPSTLPDPLPTVVLEAMAHRKPVVGTAHGGITEMIIEGITGYLIPPDDPAASAEIIQQLVGNRSLQLQMGAVGRKVVNTRFSPERYKSLILEAVKKICKDSAL